jgi:hypothetical protein
MNLKTCYWLELSKTKKHTFLLKKPELWIGRGSGLSAPSRSECRPRLFLAFMDPDPDFLSLTELNLVDPER